MRLCAATHFRLEAYDLHYPRLPEVELPPKALLAPRGKHLSLLNTVGCGCGVVDIFQENDEFGDDDEYKFATRYESDGEGEHEAVDKRRTSRNYEVPDITSCKFLGILEKNVDDVEKGRALLDKYRPRRHYTGVAYAKLLFLQRLRDVNSNVAKSIKNGRAIAALAKTTGETGATKKKWERNQRT